jgi:hypothetical protein
MLRLERGYEGRVTKDSLIRKSGIFYFFKFLFQDGISRLDQHGTIGEKYGGDAFVAAVDLLHIFTCLLVLLDIEPRILYLVLAENLLYPEAIRAPARAVNLYL